MQHIVTITSQGQLTIPKKVKDMLGIKTGTKAVLTVKGDTFTVEPKDSFWELEGSLGRKTKVKLTDSQLRKARKRFEKEWADAV